MSAHVTRRLTERVTMTVVLDGREMHDGLRDFLPWLERLDREGWRLADVAFTVHPATWHEARQTLSADPGFALASRFLRRARRRGLDRGGAWVAGGASRTRRTCRS